MDLLADQRGEEWEREGGDLQILAWPLRGSEPGNQTRSCGKEGEFVVGLGHAECQGPLAFLLLQTGRKLCDGKDYVYFHQHYEPRV